MKPILTFTACILLIAIVIFLSCKKDPVKAENHFPPVANAGPDMTLTLSSCAPGFTVLDGSGSSDPDNNINSYRWTKISGASSATISNYTSPKAKAEGILAGQYAFELMVTDAGGLSSKDTMVVNATGPGGEYNLDSTSEGTFAFHDNYADCYYGPPCWYYDWTMIQGPFSVALIGRLNFSVYEDADTASSSSVHNTYMSLTSGNGNGPAAWGTCSVNFKQLIQKGGGLFNGTFKVDGGSAQACNRNIYANLNPLAITGNLDTTAHTVSVSIKGKIYF